MTSENPTQASPLELVVIGNGMAGMRAVEELLALAPARYRITVFGAEPYGNYNRIMLSPVLAGEKTVDDIVTHDRGWYAERGITLHAGDPVTAIDRRRRMVYSASGRVAPYDRLLLATGATPVIIPVPGHTLDGVITFRDIGDVQAMLEAAAGGGRAVVIGGGLLGLEAAYGLHRQGMDVTVVHLPDRLMERQLDPVAAELLRHSLAQRGLKFRMGSETAAILGENRVTGVRFANADASTINADLVVMAVGIRPHVQLAKDAGLHCGRGVTVDDTLQTFDPRIYAVGECVEHRRATYGLVAPLWDQARVCANHLAERGHHRYAGSVTATRLKVAGVDVWSAGDFVGDDGSQALVFSDFRRGVYKRIVLEDNRVTGAVLYGDVADGGWYFELMQDATDVGALRDTLLFGRACRDAATAGEAA
ncbi:NAD(P)/FAD-dependent oxidoreductase [Salinisphaera sp.]|uniref:NAD(P)/FAD-dependent oxidoreductase n=1 Tax=Salinisphaera sp. TaxID=1914330 RepID=UPI002D7A3E85|nr:FAD-dependent oxidoreductase [Salinisphaera sp.]HET7313449.1 FAD-dependent oxidoreductase [Salinisphaera sp.]